MPKLGERNIAATSAAAVIIVLLGGTVATPVAIDTVDVDPNHPLYPLERIGGKIKRPFVDRAIINLVIRNQLRKEHINKKGNGVFLGERGRNLVANAVMEKLSTYRRHWGVKTKLKRHIRNQAIALSNHILGKENYEPYTSQKL